MRNDEHIESISQVLWVDYSLIWWVMLSFEKHFLSGRWCYLYINSTVFYSLYVTVKKKKNRFRKLSNLPMVRQLGSGWAGIRGTQECLIPRQAHVLSPGLTCLYSYSNKDFGKLLKEVWNKQKKKGRAPKWQMQKRYTLTSFLIWSLALKLHLFKHPRNKDLMQGAGTDERS